MASGRRTEDTHINDEYIFPQEASNLHQDEINSQFTAPPVLTLIFLRRQCLQAVVTCFLVSIFGVFPNLERRQCNLARFANDNETNNATNFSMVRNR